jgi:hypothetical protein
MKRTFETTSACLAAGVLLAVGTATTALAATLQLPQIVPRPLTPGEKTTYGLPAATEVSGGLRSVGVGQPFYLEVEVDATIPASNIVSVVWALTGQPVNSVAALTNSPLGPNVPVYEPSDRQLYQVALGRTLLRPDVVGQYTVTAALTTTSGATNLSITLTAGTYVGVNTCALCHSGGIVAQDMYQPWTNTAHAHIFSQGIDGLLGFYSQSCLPCHTVGYDTTASAVNGGFDDVAKQTGWTFPAVLTNGNWAGMQATNASLANVANIQCENCHGPGSQHAYSLGDTNLISRTVLSGDCNQCHDAPTHHVKGTEWYVSRHALTTGPAGAGREACVGCHASEGFIGRVEGDSTTNAVRSAIGCQTCHEPHGLTMPTNNPHLLRVLGPVTMPDGTVVTNAGEGALCLQCHHNRNGSVTNMLAKYPLGQPTWVGGSSFGPHDGPQGDMIEGINAVTYGQVIPSSAHRYAVTDLCVGCHMQTVGATDPAFLHAGGHTFAMSYNVVTNGVTNTVDKVDACVQCHGPIASFDMPRGDYNGDGIIEGVQTEVQHLLDKLSTLLPNATYQPSGNYVADGLVKTSVRFQTNWPTKFLNAGYNWQFVNNDGSRGVHNVPFAVGLLKASIGDLTGDANNDGLPDAWQIQYFGSANNPSAAPNATPAGDGIPNWLKYGLGLNPTVPGIVLPDGVVWANGSPSGVTNSIRIYTAAEVVFNTVAGTTYQLQSISSLGGGWQNVGNPITATTTGSMSFLTPTRNNKMQFYRVAHSP